MENKNSLLELKALAYDLIGQIQFLQQKLNNVNVEISKLSQQQVEKLNQNKK